MTRTIVLNEDGIESLNCLIEYSFQKEMEDYIDHVAQGNPADYHVFVSLVHLRNLLYETTEKPEDFLKEEEIEEAEEDL